MSSQSQAETQKFIPQEDDSETLYEVIEIVGERKRKKGGLYQVRWAGVDAKGKPWPLDWVPKGDVTDDLKEAWKAKKAASAVKIKEEDEDFVIRSGRSRAGKKATTSRATSSTSTATRKSMRPTSTSTRRSAQVSTSPAVSKADKSLPAKASTLNLISPFGLKPKPKPVTLSPLTKKRKRQSTDSNVDSEDQQHQLEVLLPRPPKKRRRASHDMEHKSASPEPGPARSPSPLQTKRASAPPSPPLDEPLEENEIVGELQDEPLASPDADGPIEYPGPVMDVDDAALEDGMDVLPHTLKQQMPKEDAEEEGEVIEDSLKANSQEINRDLPVPALPKIKRSAGEANLTCLSKGDRARLRRWERDMKKAERIKSKGKTNILVVTDEDELGIHLQAGVDEPLQDIIRPQARQEDEAPVYALDIDLELDADSDLEAVKWRSPVRREGTMTLREGLKIRTPGPLSRMPSGLKPKSKPLAAIPVLSQSAFKPYLPHASKSHSRTPPQRHDDEEGETIEQFSSPLKKPEHESISATTRPTQDEEDEDFHQRRGAELAQAFKQRQREQVDSQSQDHAELVDNLEDRTRKAEDEYPALHTPASDTDEGGAYLIHWEPAQVSPSHELQDIPPVPSPASTPAPAKAANYDDDSTRTDIDTQSQEKKTKVLERFEEEESTQDLLDEEIQRDLWKLPEGHNDEGESDAKRVDHQDQTEREKHTPIGKEAEMEFIITQRTSANQAVSLTVNDVQTVAHEVDLKYPPNDDMDLSFAANAPDLQREPEPESEPGPEPDLPLNLEPQSQPHPPTSDANDASVAHPQSSSSPKASPNLLDEALKDRDFYREQYTAQSTYVTSTRKENVELKSRVAILEKQVSEGVLLIRQTFEGRVKWLEDNVNYSRGQVKWMQQLTERKEAKEMAELKKEHSALESEVQLLRAALRGNGTELIGNKNGKSNQEDWGEDSDDEEWRPSTRSSTRPRTRAPTSSLTPPIASSSTLPNREVTPKTISLTERVAVSNIGNQVVGTPHVHISSRQPTPGSSGLPVPIPPLPHRKRPAVPTELAERVQPQQSSQNDKPNEDGSSAGEDNTTEVRKFRCCWDRCGDGFVAREDLVAHFLTAPGHGESTGESTGVT